MFTAFASLASAQVTWDGGAGTNLWNDAANWDTDALPGNGDDVVIDGDSVVIDYDLGVTIDDIDIINGGVLNVISGGVISTDNSGGNQGNVEVTDGTFYISGGSVTIGDYITVDGSNSSLITTSGTLLIDGDTNPLHDLLFSNGATGNIGNGSEVFLNNEFVLDDATVTISGHVENLILANGGPHDIEMRGTSTLFVEDGAVIIMEDIDFGTGDGTSTVIINGGSVTLKDDLKFNDGQDGDGITLNGGELTVEDQILLGSSNAEVTVNGGTLNSGGVDGNEAPYFYETDPMVQADTLFFVTDEGVAVSIGLNVFDAEDDGFVITSGQPNLGSLTEIDSVNYDYEPTENTSGVDHFQMTVTDDNNTLLTSNVIIRVTINDLNDPPYFYDEDPNTPADSLFFTTFVNDTLDFCLNVFDPEGDPFDISLVLLKNGSGTLEQTTPQNCFQYIPDLDFEGVDHVPVLVCDASDGSLCELTTVQISTIPVPPISSLDTLIVSTNEDVTVTFCSEDFNIIGDPYTLSRDSLTSGSGSIVDEEDECFEYLPPADFNGVDYVSFTMCEVDDPEICTITVVQLTTQPVNDAPRIIFSGIESDSVFISTDINTAVTIGIEATEVDGDSTFVQLFGPDLDLGTVSDFSGLSFTYTPDPDTMGIELVDIFVCDDSPEVLCDTAVLRIQFPEEDSAPEFIVDNQPVDTLVFQITDEAPFLSCINILNREGDPLDIEIADIVSGSGSLDFTLEEDFCFEYTSGDDPSSTAMVTLCDDDDLCSDLIMVFNVNHAPRLLDEEQNALDSIFLQTGFNRASSQHFVVEEIDGDSIYIQSVNTLTGTGAFTAELVGMDDSVSISFSPVIDFTGINTFSIVLCDNGDPAICKTFFISVEVFEFNTAPVFMLDGSAADTVRYQIDEGMELQTCLEIFDAEGDSTFLEIPEIISDEGVLTNAVDSGMYCLSYVPTPLFFGLYEFTVELCDGKFEGCTNLMIEIVINPTNESPVVAADSASVPNSDVIVLNLIQNDIDPENEGLFLDPDFQITPTFGTVIVESDSTISYLPDPDEYKGSETFTYSVCDAGVPEICVTGTVTIFFQLPVPNLFIYEGFSPNGDGINDTWFIDGIREFPNSMVRVFDEWNNLVYETRNYDNRDIVWDGRSNVLSDKGMVREGTYYYAIDLGNGDTRTGFVVLKK